MTERSVTPRAAKTLLADTAGKVEAEVHSSDPLLGTILSGKYRISSVLAEGGMGRVYQGSHLTLGRKVAVKVVLPELSALPEIVSRFRLEAQLCAQLSHPNVVSVLDFGQRGLAEGGELFAVMELVEGPTLEEMLGAGVPFDLRRVAGLMEQLLIALDYAHENGVVHRDVKPANVVIQTTEAGAERVKLIDFGIAQAQLNAGLRTRVVSGTPEYMAPEQALGAAATQAVDIYAAGIVLFQLLTGCVPFFGTTVQQILGKHLTTDRPDPRKTAPGRSIPEGFASACMRAMALEPQDRFQTAADFGDALVEARRRLSSKAPPADPSAGSGARPVTPRPPQILTKPPSGSSRYSLKPRLGEEDATRDRPTPAAAPDFVSLMRMEEAAAALLSRGESERALATLHQGLRAAKAAVLVGERELGQTAVRTFALKLAKVYEGLGQNELRRNVLFGVLNLVPATDPGRAELLKHLALAEQDLKNPRRAQQLRVEAHGIALRHGDESLATELSRLLEGQASGALPKVQKMPAP